MARAGLDASAIAAKAVEALGAVERPAALTAAE